jgi:hypothetical protein
MVMTGALPLPISGTGSLQPYPRESQARAAQRPRSGRRAAPLSTIGHELGYGVAVLSDASSLGILYARFVCFDR